MKKKLTFKKITIYILLIIFLSTYAIGEYFVNYAMVPNSDGEKRNIKNSLKIENDILEKSEKLKTLRENEAIAWAKKFKNNEVSIKSKEGFNIFGHVFKNKISNIWVIVIHGYQQKEYKTFDLAKNFHKIGYNVLTISQRAHGKSEGKYITMGLDEKDDLLRWAEFLRKINPKNKIIFHGTSMGASTALMAASEYDKNNLIAVIEDSGYSNVWKIFEKELKKRFNLPAFPVLYMSNIMAKIKTGHFLKSGDVLRYVENIKVPVMVIHSESDDFVPIEMGKEIYANLRNKNKEFYRINNAKHADVKYVEEKQYYGKIKDFIESNLN